MKNSLKLAAATLCLALGATFSQAQTNTNVVTLKLQTLNIALTGFVGGGTNGTTATSFRIATKDVIKATGVSSNSAAKLQVGSATLVSDAGTNESLVFLVTTGTAKDPVFTDVSPFFLVDTNSALLVKGNTGYQIMTFGFGVDTNGVALTNILGGPLTPVSFLVQGFTTLSSSGAFTSTVNGPGTSGSSSAVLKGTISATAPGKQAVTVTIIR